MSKAALAGLILCLILMASLFFVSGFLSGVQVGWREGHSAAEERSSSTVRTPAATMLHGPASSSASASVPAQAPSAELKATSTIVPVLKTIERLDHLPGSIQNKETQWRIKMDASKQRLKHPLILGAFEHIADKQHGHHHHRLMPRKPSPSALSEHGTFTLRAGLYPTLQEANLAAQHVRNAGYEPSVSKITKAGYRVCAGVFNNRTVAQKALKKLKKQGFAYAVLVPLYGSAP